MRLLSKDPNFSPLSFALLTSCVVLVSSVHACLLAPVSQERIQCHIQHFRHKHRTRLILRLSGFDPVQSTPLGATTSSTTSYPTTSSSSIPLLHLQQYLLGTLSDQTRTLFKVQRRLKASRREFCVKRCIAPSNAAGIGSVNTRILLGNCSSAFGTNIARKHPADTLALSEMDSNSIQIAGQRSIPPLPER